MRPPRHTALLVVVAVLVAGPKIPLIETSGSAIRVEDGLLAGVGVWFAIGGGAKRYAFDTVDRSVFAFTGALIVAALVGAATGRVGFLTAMLYAVRPLEYWLMKPVVRKLNRPDLVERVLFAYTFVLLASSLLQAVGIQVGDSLFGSDRAAGTTAGPFEAAAVTAGLCLYWISKRRLLPAGAAGLGLLLTQSRTTTVALLIVLLVLSVRVADSEKSPTRKRVVSLSLAARLGGVIAVLCLGLFGSILAPSLPVMSRLASTSPTLAYQQAQDIISADAPITNQSDYYAATYSAGRLYEGSRLLDPSTTIRLMRWGTLLRALKADPKLWAFGAGPSFAFSAVDGYYVRVLVEAGVVGAMVFAIMLGAMYRAASQRRDLAVRAYIVVLIFTGLTIDIWVTMKAMLLLWTMFTLREDGEFAI